MIERKKRLKQWKVRPVQEELGDAVMSGMFSVVWYGGLVSHLLRGGPTGNMGNLFLMALAGLLPLYMTITQTRQAVFYRKKRREAVLAGRKRRGKIVRVFRTTEQKPSGKGNRKMVYRYYLEVEISDPVTGACSVVKSHAYRKPFYGKLGSPYVDVYADSSGWNYYLEGFQKKEHADDPDVFSTEEFPDPAGNETILKVLFVVIALWILLS